jgi:hypothetical protein
VKKAMAQLQTEVLPEKGKARPTVLINKRGSPSIDSSTSQWVETSPPTGFLRRWPQGNRQHLKTPQLLSLLSKLQATPGLKIKGAWKEGS